MFLTSILTLRESFFLNQSTAAIATTATNTTTAAIEPKGIKVKPSGKFRLNQNKLYAYKFSKRNIKQLHLKKGLVY